MSCCDKQVKLWDLATNQATQVAAHEAPVKTIRWVKAPQYQVTQPCVTPNEVVCL